MSKSQTTKSVAIIAWLIEFAVTNALAIAFCVFVLDFELGNTVVGVTLGTILTYSGYYSGFKKGRKSV